MKIEHITKLILKFIGGGKIQIPTRFLKSVDIESSDINNNINSNEILDLGKEILDIFGKDIKKFRLDDKSSPEFLGDAFNNNPRYEAYILYIDDTIDGNGNPDFIDKFTDNIKYISINNINFKIVNKNIEDRFTMTIICDKIALYITQDIIQIYIANAVNNYTGEE